MRRGVVLGSVLLSIVLAAAVQASLAAATATGASRACPAPRSRPIADIFKPVGDAVIACVGTIPIVGSQVAHWTDVELHDPPRPATRTGALKQAMEELLNNAWIAAEARAQHVTISAAALRQDYAREVHKSFENAAALHRFEQRTHLTAADLLLRMRTEQLSAALLHRAAGHGDARSRKRAISRHARRFQTHWLARTACLNAYAVDACGRPLDAKPVAHVGGHPTGIAVDERSETIYVASAADDSLSMIDGATCNAQVASGCAHAPTVPTAGVSPIGVALDPSTETLYVANAGSNTVAVLDAATCSAEDTSGCAKPPVLVHVGGGPELLAVDPATHTIYVPNTSSGTVSVIDGRSCNAADTSGCGRAPATVQVGSDPELAVLDPATATLFVANTGLDSLSLLDAHVCNAADTSGCAAAPRRVVVGFGPLGLAIDAITDTVFAATAAVGEVAVLDGATCNATHDSSCSHGPHRIPVGSDARGALLDPATRTLYVANAGSDDVSMIDAHACTASHPGGCTTDPYVALVGASPRRLALDPKSETIYVTDAEAGTVSMLDGATCNATVTAGC